MFSQKAVVSSCALLLVLLVTAGAFAADSKPLPSSLAAKIETLQANAAAVRPMQTLTVTALGGIRGVVHGLDSADVGLVYVNAWTDSIPKEGYYYKGFAVVDSTFSYQIDSLAAGRYYVSIWAEGYANKYYPDVSDFSRARPVPVLEGQITDHINFTMEKLSPGTGRISGRVVDDAGHPVFHAIVYVHASDEPFNFGKAETDLDGHFVIEGLKAGSYLVQIVSERFLGEFYDNVYDAAAATLVSVTEPGETVLADIALSVGASLSGRVVDQNDRPVVGAHVQAMIPRADGTISDKPEFYEQNSTKTDEDGFYRIQGLAPGAYVVTAIFYDAWYSCYAYYPEGQNPAQARTVTVQADEQIEHIDIRMRIQSGAGSVSGRVLDRSGQPFEGASVYLQSLYDPAFAGPYFGMSARTDREGKYNFERVPVGSYQISCWAQSGWQSAYRWWPDGENMEQAQVLQVNENDHLDAIDFNLPITIGRSSIHGYVLDSQGRPLTWANVQVTPVSESETAAQSFVYASTDSNGFYQIDQLTAGDYLVYASYWENQSFGRQWWDHKDSVGLADKLQLADGEKRGKVDFELTVKPAYGAIVGTVTDAATGLPIPRAYIEIKIEKMEFNKMMRPFWYYPFYAFTDENGFFAFESLREGSYILSAYCNGGFAYYQNGWSVEEATPVQVIGGVKTEANFSMKLRNDGNGVISGLVEQDYDIQPVDETGNAVSPGRNAAGFQTVSAHAIEGAVVIAKPALTILQWPQSEMFYTAVTGPDGTYQLTGLPAGDYYVKSFSAYYMTEYFDNVFDPSEATLVSVTETEPRGDVNFKLSPIYYLFLKESALDSRTYNGAMVYGRITDKDGNAVPDATVYLLDENGNAVGVTNSTADGSYQLAGMNAGNYTLQAVKMGFAATYNGNVGSNELAERINVGNGTLQVDLTLSTLAPTGVESSDNAALPESVVLFGNYPNPFNPSTQIRFSLPKALEVTLAVYDLSGREVARLQKGKLSAGVHTIEWNGRSAASGVYVYHLHAGSQVVRGKMVMLK